MPRWEPLTDHVIPEARTRDDKRRWICSQCGFIAPKDRKKEPWSCFGCWEYCPGCGSKMEAYKEKLNEYCCKN